MTSLSNLGATNSLNFGVPSLTRRKETSGTNFTKISKSFSNYAQQKQRHYLLPTAIHRMSASAKQTQVE